MKNLTWQNPEQLFVAQELTNKVKSKYCGIKGLEKRLFNVATSRAIRNTYIICPNNIAEYTYMSAEVRNYLMKLKSELG